MSVELYPASGPGGNNESLQGTTVGGSKPLHRFMKGQPKIVGITVLALGVSFFIVPISVNVNVTFHHISAAVSPAFLSGAMFLISGIMFILTEHNTTKTIVTVSLALSIMTILVAIWSILFMISHFLNPQNYTHYNYPYFEDNTTETEDMDWRSYSESMRLCLEALFLFYTSVAIIIFSIMSSLARAAIRSTKSETVVVMTTMPTQAPAE